MKKSVLILAAVVIVINVIFFLYITPDSPEQNNKTSSVTLGEPLVQQEKAKTESEKEKETTEETETLNTPANPTENQIETSQKTTTETSTEVEKEDITIANWNLKIFGTTKASNKPLMTTYASIMDNYDIVFVQEIRNADQTAFPKLCDLLPDYECAVSSRAGRSTSKEQYGIIYRKGIELIDLEDFNPDSLDRWERPPIRASFRIGDHELMAYNIHIKPDDAPAEMRALNDLIMTTGYAVKDNNIIVLGDLNADCSYYNNENEDDFETNWNWLIKDEEDTTVASTDCAYDRIILNNEAMEEYSDYGIYNDVSSEMSDHYLVWVKLEVETNSD
jgi:endonuclease/exonuclease/phosphatase family metal-dependent hydrolase